MIKQRTPHSGIRQFLKDNTYLHGGKLFFRSRRGFRLLAAPIGISPPEEFSHFEKVDVYVTPGWWLGSLFQPQKTFSAVVVPKTFGRFGNQTVQLANALTIARSTNSCAVFCPGNEILPSFRAELQGISLNTRQGTLSRVGLVRALRGLLSSLQPRSHLVGNFFYTTAIAANTVTPEARTASYAVIKTAMESVPSVTPLPKEHLVIHLRGGDAFGPHAHNEYGQPPFAFYELVLSNQLWSHVTIVSEDDVNPVFPEIVALARDRAIPCSTQSGSLDEDMQVLFSATALVSSRSTFIPAVTAFSKNIDTVYVFGDDDRFRSDITIRRVVDIGGKYWDSICRYNWRDEPWQRELMVDYPVINLGWLDDGGDQ